MRRLIALAMVVLCVSATKAAVTGSFYVDGYAAPTAGQQMRFYTETSPINDCCGGDSVLAWVDVACASGGVQVLSIIAPADSPVTPNVQDFKNYANVLLDSAAWQGAGYPAATCTSYLFWDGAHRPRRQKNNTLAGPLIFSAASGL